MFIPRNRQQRRSRRPIAQPLRLEALEDRTLLSTTPTTTILDLNGLTVNSNQYSSTDILVQFQGTPGTPGGPAIVTGTTLAEQLPLATGFYQVDLSNGMTVAQALSAYQAEKGVLDAEPDYELSVSSVPNDPLLSQQSNLNNTGQNGGTAGADIHAEEAWSVTTGSPNIIVAVLDTGVDYDDPDLADNIWINQAEIPDYWYTKSSPTSGYNTIVYKSEIKTATPGVITFADLNNPVNKGLVWDNNGDGIIDAGDLLLPISEGGWESASNTQDGDTAQPDDLFGWNFVNNNNNPLDQNGHGTNVAGILGATGNNGIGVAGVDWNVQIMPVQFMGADGEGSVSNFIQALNYAVQHGAKITNNSWEGAPYSTALYDAFLNAQQQGVISVVAAGNEGADDDTTPDYPASLSESLNSVVAVAATTDTDQLASFSNYGSHSVALAAPGVNILSTLPNDQYGTMSGTSMAAPEVAGAMALVWGLHPSWTYTQVIDQVLDTTDKLPSLQGKVSTGGRLDLAAAVGWNLSTTTTPTVTSVNVQGPTGNSMDSLVLTFNEPIDVSSFTAAAVTLTNPSGSTIPVSVSVVANSGDLQMTLTFADQTLVGDYKLSINSSVRDTMGVALAPYQSTIALQAAQTYTNSTPSAITAGGLTMSSLTVPAGATIGNLEVSLNATYPDDSNLYVYLISPAGKVIALDYNRGGTGANLTNTVFSEQASTAIASGKAPFSGTYIPEESLSQLIGISAGGNWRLAIKNSGSGSGTLLNWSLIITPATTVTPTNSTSTSAATTYTNSTSSAITAGGLTMSSLTVPAGATIGNLEVSLNATYPNDSNLYVYLISPAGKVIALDYNRGGTGANLTNTVFSEQASTAIASGKAPFSGTYIPEESLSQLIGISAGGNWRLAIKNSGSGSGTLLNWSLIITPAATVTPTNSTSTSAATTYTNSTSSAITAGGLTMSSLTVPAGATIGNLEVSLNATYPDDSNLYVYLISPAGKVIALDYNRGGTGANLTNTVFSEQASTAIASGKAPFSGTYIPEESLSQLIGISAGGNWRLAIKNSGSGSGTLLNWSLIITPAATVTPTNSTSTSAATTYTNSTSSAITAGGLTMSSLTVPAGATIGNLEVSLNATYPDDSNLYVYLISPAGKVIALDYNRGGTGANLTNTVFSEQASTAIASGKAPFSGTYIPEESLSQLIGISAGGNWRLAIKNSGSGSGTLLNWSLIITPAATTSDVKTSSVASSVSATTPSSPSSPSLSPSIVGVGTPQLSSIGGGTNTAVILPPLSSQGVNAPLSSPSLIDTIFSSTRKLGQFLSSLLVGKRPTQNLSASANE